MAPRKGRGNSDTAMQPAARSRRQATAPEVRQSGHRAASQTQSQTPAPTASPVPQTPVRQGPFRVSGYQPPPLATRPGSPEEELFDFSEADAMPPSPSPGSAALPPALGSLGSPVKRASAMRNDLAQLNKKTDLEVWDESDDIIIAAAKQSWRSNVYEHYNVALDRVFDNSGLPLKLDFIFTCKDHPENHDSAMRRDRAKSADGTTKFLKDVKQCNEKLGVVEGPPPSQSAIEFTPENHRALLAIRYAKSGRPINEVMDEDYRAEVSMLNSKAVLPHSTTVQRDLISIYIHLSTFVMNYFMGLDSAVHLVLDGWTSPLVTSYLGLVITWVANGQMNRMVLEFIRLYNSHTGEYLADVVANCLKRYGLEKKILGLCMDNASNCGRLAAVLPGHIPRFRGMYWRLRCLAHIINLVAKTFLSFFFKKAKCRKQRVEGQEEEQIADDDLAAVEEAEEDAQVRQDDEGQIAHDEGAVLSIRDQAILIMKEHGIEMTQSEEQSALNLLPKVAGLARRIHDNSFLNEKFKKLIQQDPELQSSTRTALARRVPTRWNSEYDCLFSHLYFKTIVQSITGVRENRLKPYRLDDYQWDLAEDLLAVLVLFKDLTDLFSKAETPLVADALPMLLLLRDRLVLVIEDNPVTEGSSDSDSSTEGSDDNNSDDSDHPTPAVIRIASQAAVLFINKYLDLMWDCDIYIIAIVLCPDRKLAWFKDNFKYSAAEMKKLKSIVTKAWASYEPEKAAPAPKPAKKKLTRAEQLESSQWTKSSAAPKKYPYDHIETYLSEAAIPSDPIQSAGGYLEYWTSIAKSRPTVARMALDYVSAPASSVDAERAFSTGRRQVNFMQHNMSSNTFQARMAVGSWAKSTMFPGIPEIGRIIREHGQSSM